MAKKIRSTEDGQRIHCTERDPRFVRLKDRIVAGEIAEEVLAERCVIVAGLTKKARSMLESLSRKSERLARQRHGRYVISSGHFSSVQSDVVHILACGLGLPTGPIRFTTRDWPCNLVFFFNCLKLRINLMRCAMPTSWTGFNTLTPSASMSPGYLKSILVGPFRSSPTL